MAATPAEVPVKGPPFLNHDNFFCIHIDGYVGFVLTACIDEENVRLGWGFKTRDGGLPEVSGRHHFQFPYFLIYTMCIVCVCDV
ncbi:hypothetical protein Pfo_006324 [Paulownia fortunei]|nr:hypothetical protein Pfo_006324 [Paulownia fortunei]